MLDQQHANRRQLDHLVAAEPTARPLLILCELAPAAATRPRPVLDDLIDPILGRQRAPRARMPRLPAGLAPLTLSVSRITRIPQV
jgi:hypothetical protein